MRHFIDARYFDLERPVWLRGGFPDAFLARDAKSCRAWHEAYLRTFVERNIARHQLKVSATEVRWLPAMLAHSHGGLLNYSTLGRSLGYSYHTVQNLIDFFAGYFLVRRLQPYHANVEKRLVKAPKVYLRDSGMLHHLLGIETAEQLHVSPARGASFEGFMIQQIAAIEELQRPASAFYFYRTYVGAEIDLLIDRGRQRIGFEFKVGVATDAHDWKHLQTGIDDGVIHRGCVVNNGTRKFSPIEGVTVVPAARVLAGELE